MLLLALRHRHAQPWSFARHGSRRAYKLKIDPIPDLEQRGLIANITRRDDLCAEIQKDQQVVYAGVDPTGKALHVGHLLPLVSLLHFTIRSHRVIVLIGGATGLVGDPSFRATERDEADPENLSHNVTHLKAAVKSFFTRATEYAEQRVEHKEPSKISPAEVHNNLDWHSSLGFLDFLRTVGSHVRVSTMLARDSVQTRLQAQQGLSFAELTYQLLQAYDFHHLHKTARCTVQIGGSDQWGNILAGVDLISRLTPGANAFGITTPLLTTDAGEKFGKSAGNAVWLDERMTSVLDFYQFFLKTADGDVERYLKGFTLLSMDQIHAAMEQHNSDPGSRHAQRLLADEITHLVHGPEGVVSAHAGTKLLFGTDLSTVGAADLVRALGSDPRLVRVQAHELFDMPLTKLAGLFKLTSSTSAAHQLAKAGGLYLNNVRTSDPQRRLTRDDLMDESFVVLRAGKDSYLVLMLT